jgi:Flp pilus assembly protein TadG
MLDRLTGNWRWLCSVGTAGAAAVEFAITAPLLILLALGAADYGAITNNGSSLEGATRAVAEIARDTEECVGGGLTNSDCTNQMYNLISTLKSNDTSLSSASFTVPNCPALPTTCTTSTNYCTCTDGYDGGTGSCSTTITTAVCTSRVPADPRVLQYIRIAATLSVTPLVSYASFTFPSSLSAQTTTRIQ